MQGAEVLKFAIVLMLSFVALYRQEAATQRRLEWRAGLSGLGQSVDGWSATQRNAKTCSLLRKSLVSIATATTIRIMVAKGNESLFSVTLNQCRTPVLSFYNDAVTWRCRYK